MAEGGKNQSNTDNNGCQLNDRYRLTPSAQKDRVFLEALESHVQSALDRSHWNQMRASDSSRNDLQDGKSGICSHY